MSMAHSLEARAHDGQQLTAYMEQVPARLKLKGMRKKHIMRRAIGILPPAIINKKKVGLELPYSR
jgi:asparagine synthetase B (glutamine-hydrolysing)